LKYNIKQVNMIMNQMKRNPEKKLNQLIGLSRAQAEFLHAQGRLPRKFVPRNDVLTDRANSLSEAIDKVAPPLYVDEKRQAPFNQGASASEIIRRLDIDPVTKKGGRIADNAFIARIELSRYEGALNFESPTLEKSIRTAIIIKRSTKWNKILSVGRKVGAVLAVAATGVLSYMATRYGVMEAGVNGLYLAVTATVAAIAARAVSRVKVPEAKHPIPGAEEVRKTLGVVRETLSKVELN
jgi:hypothetical protein